jgi:hypothetical protein
MRKRQVQIPVLCEDDEHQSFALQYLERRGYSRWKVRLLPYPASGKGSGKESVRRRYVEEVRAIRRYCQMHRSQTYALVVMIDQDAPSQPDPYLDLDRRLTDAQLARRTADEHIAIFAPKYSVETWAYHLLDTARPVDETTNFSERRYGIGGPECRRAGTEFATYDPALCPLPSLVAACKERQRIP